MAAGLRALGVHVSTVRRRALGRSGRGPLRGPAHVDVGLAGTVMRFLPPVAGARRRPGHLRRRPAGPQPPAARRWSTALRALGVRIDAAPDRRPAADRARRRPGRRRRGGRSTRPRPASSSPACCSPRRASTAASWCATRARRCRQRAAPADDRADAARGRRGGRRQRRPTSGRSSRAGSPAAAWDIEPDLSGAAPFFAAALVTGGAVTLRGWPRSSRPARSTGCASCSPRMGGEVDARHRRADRARHRRASTASTPTCPRWAS